MLSGDVVDLKKFNLKYLNVRNIPKRTSGINSILLQCHPNYFNILVGDKVNGGEDGV